MIKPNIEYLTRIDAMRHLIQVGDIKEIVEDITESNRRALRFRGIYVFPGEAFAVKSYEAKHLAMLVLAVQVAQVVEENINGHTVG